MLGMQQGRVNDRTGEGKDMIPETPPTKNHVGHGLISVPDSSLPRPTSFNSLVSGQLGGWARGALSGQSIIQKMGSGPYLIVRFVEWRH